MGATARPGSLVAFWEGGSLAIAVVTGEEKQRVRLVLEGGREARVNPARILFTVDRGFGVPGASAEERRLAGERVSERVRRLRERCREVDVALVWEIALEAAGAEGPGAPMQTAELSALALGDDSGDARVALVWALERDGLHFTRKGEDWEPRGTAAVEELKLQRRRIAERETETAAVYASLRAAAAEGSYAPTRGEVERRILEALERLAVEVESAPESVRDTALEALHASGLRWDRPHEAAFRLLRRIGLFDSDDENLQVRRFRLRTSFPDEALELARDVTRRGPRPGGREDLTGLETFSVDSPSTREIDDALSAEELPGGGVRVGVHIADPAAFVTTGDALDREALARGITHYFPDSRLPMFPPQISEEAASLIEGQERPTLSFLLDLDAEGRLVDTRFCRSIIRSRARLDYEWADRIIGGESAAIAGPLRLLDRAAGLREATRVRSGAAPIRAPEVDVHVSPDGEITLERIPPDSAARRAVTEGMILAGAAAAEICREAGVPAIYRRQAPPAAVVELPAPGVMDPVLTRAARRSLKRAEVSLQPGPHFSLGLEAYAQVTSPLRRFQDLATHRQLLAVLAGGPPAYDAEELQRIAATTEQVEAEARQAERACADYWLLRYLERRTGEWVEAWVVETRPRAVVQLVETLWEQPMPSLRGVEPGQLVRLRIERVNPRAGLLVLRRET